MLENKQHIIFRKIIVHSSNVRKGWFYREINAYKIKYWDTKHRDFTEILLWNSIENTSEI